MAHVKQLESEVRELTDLLKVGPSELVAKTRKVLRQLKDKERELEQVKLKLASGAKDEADVRTYRASGSTRNGRTAWAWLNCARLSISSR